MRATGPGVLVQRIAQVIRDRRQKQAMSEASYWDARARGRSGFARSVWHSETFSQAWDARQQALLRRELGPLGGLRVADVGCGTGRISRFLAREGAATTGFDFSPATVEAARDEAREAQVEVSFVVADVTSGALPCEPGSFDLALAVGCLAVACRDLDALERCLGAMARATRPGGRVVLLEPIHRTPIVGRVLRASVGAWVKRAERAGLRLEKACGMGFLPIRLAFSSLDAPPWVVEPIFDAGEGALDALPWLERAADYRLLIFQVAASP